MKKVMGMLNFGSFPGKALFIAGFTFEEVCKELEKQNCKEWLQAFKYCKYLTGEGVAGFSSIQTLRIKGANYQYAFVFLRDKFDFKNTDHHAFLSHELIHTCTHYLSPMFDVVKENEAFAYTHTHLTKQCYQILKTTKVKKSKGQ